MKRVLVTGATSMIGIALIEECLRNEVEVYALVRPHSFNIKRLPKSKSIHLIEADLASLEEIELPGASIDVLYHMGWAYTSKTTRINPMLQEYNIRYTLSAVELAKKLGCKKFVGAGSQAEYGRKNDIMINEETPVSPEIAYGVAKYAAGRLSMLLCQTYDIEWVWGRIFSVYGPYDNQETMLRYAISELLQGHKPVFTAATQMWDYLYSEDAGRAFYGLGEKKGIDGTYCVASGFSQPLKNYILEMRDMINPELELEFGKEQSENVPLSLNASIEKLTRDTGFLPEISFKEGIKRMIQQIRQDM